MPRDREFWCAREWKFLWNLKGVSPAVLILEPVPLMSRNLTHVHKLSTDGKYKFLR